MTEIIETPAPPRRHLIDPVAFFVALVAAPIVVAAATFWILFIPVAAVVFGGPLYLITATPVMLWWLARRAPDVGEIALLGFVTNLAACGAIYAYEVAGNPNANAELSALYLIFGTIFAPLWAGVFAALYKRMRRPFFKQIV